MATATGPIGAEDRRHGKREITDGIERLVAHELIRVAETFAVDDSVVTDGNGVLERGAKGETGSPQALHILHEAEGAGAGKLAAERTGIDIHLDSLTADHGAVKVDFDVEMKTVMRREFAKRAS